MIRVLYGDSFEERRPKIIKDLKRSLGSPAYGDFARSMTYYCMGREAEDLLRSYGAEDIRRVCDAPYMITEGGNPLYTWNKLYLIREAIIEHAGPVLYTDMDVFCTWCYDRERLGQLLGKRTGLARWLQMPLIQYHKKYFWFRPHVNRKTPNRISPRLGLWGCFIYASDAYLIDRFLGYYE
jgi:hypothetical protein